MTFWESRRVFFFRAEYIYFIIKGNFVEILWYARVPGLGALRGFSGPGGWTPVKNVGRKWGSRESQIIELLAAQLTRLTSRGNLC